MRSFIPYTEIVELVAQGEAKGYELLYRSYGDRLYGYAIRNWSFDEDTSWDLVYKTFDNIKKLILSGTTFDSEAHFTSYVFRAFINNLKYAYRTLQKQQIEFVPLPETNDEGLSDEDSDEVCSDQLDVEELKDYSDNSDNAQVVFKVNAVLEQMDQSDREILLLRAQDFSYKQIAAMLKCEEKEGQLKVKHLRAKKKFIKIYQG